MKIFIVDSLSEALSKASSYVKDLRSMIIKKTKSGKWEVRVFAKGV